MGESDGSTFGLGSMSSFSMPDPITGARDYKMQRDKVSDLGTAMARHGTLLSGVKSATQGIDLPVLAFGAVGGFLAGTHNQVRDDAAKAVEAAKGVVESWKTALQKAAEHDKEANETKGNGEGGPKQPKPKMPTGGPGGGLGKGGPDLGGLGGAGGGPGDFDKLGDMEKINAPGKSGLDDINGPGKPDLPGSQDLPDVPKPDIPQPDVPDMPKPDIPQPDVPDMPRTDLPQTPNPDLGTIRPPGTDLAGNNPNGPTPPPGSNVRMPDHDPDGPLGTSIRNGPGGPGAGGPGAGGVGGMGSGMPGGVGGGAPGAGGAAKGLGSGGMPMMPFAPMGGGGPGQEENGRERGATLGEDEETWTGDEEIAPPVIGLD